MRLFLTSDGIFSPVLRDAFSQHFADLRGQKVALLYTVLQEGDEKWLEHYRREFSELGLVPYEVNIGESVSLDELRECSAYYVCGGNTFSILSLLKKSGLFQLIIDNVRIFNKPYIGVSAGSIIAGEEISIAGVGTNADENAINLLDLSGLNISGYTIFPHYQDEDEEHIQAWEASHHKKYALRLSDGEAMMINDTVLARY